jgi:hypothetical protein
MGKTRRWYLSFAVVAACVLGLLAGSVQAGENWGSHYLGGNEDFMAGALPPGGTTIFLNYLVYRDVNKVMGNNGAKYKNTDIQAQALVDALRFVHVTKWEVFGGNPFWHVIAPFGYTHFTGRLNTSGGQIYFPTTPSSNVTMGDFTVGAGLKWNCPTFSNVAAIDFYMRRVSMRACTAAARARAAISSTRYRPDLQELLELQPCVGIHLPRRQELLPPGFEVSAKMMYSSSTPSTRPRAMSPVRNSPPIILSATT